MRASFGPAAGVGGTRAAAEVLQTQHGSTVAEGCGAAGIVLQFCLLALKDCMPTEFPADDTGDALRRLQRDGDDLTEARDVDFSVVFPTEGAAHQFADHFEQLGYKTSVRKSDVVAELPWDVTVVEPMVPSHAGISAVEESLQKVADIHGGRNDGWGCFARNDQWRANTARDTQG